MLSTPDKLYDAVHSGNFQVGAAVDSIEVALKQARELKKTMPKAIVPGLEEVAAQLDSVGADLAEHAGEPPTSEDVKADPDKFEKERLAALQDLEDAKNALTEAASQLESMMENQPDEVFEKLDSLTRLIEAALDDVAGAIAAYSGTAPPEPDAP
jgi:hypothetical protein